MSSYTQGMPAPAGFEKFIRPEHVQKAQFLDQNKRIQYQQGILQLWNKALASPENSGDRISACQKLAEVTQQLHRQHMNFKNAAQQAASAQAAGNAQANAQGQQSQQANAQSQQPQVQRQAPQSVPQQQQQQPAQAQNTQAVRPPSQDQQPNRDNASTVAQKRAAQLREELKRLSASLVAPAAYGPAEAQQWLEQHRNRAQQAVHQSEVTVNAISAVQKQVIDKQKISPLTDADKARVHEKMADTYSRLNKLSEVMYGLRQSFMQHQRSQGGVNAAPPGANGQKGQEQTAQVQSHAQVKNEPLEQTAAASISAASPHPATPGQAAPAQVPNPAANRPVSAQVNLPPKIEPGRPMPGPLQQNAQQPYPLSHQAAVDKARSYQQPHTQTPTSGSAHQPHPGLPNRADSQPRVSDHRGYANTNKTLNVAPLQPVPMNPARPTMSGGPGIPAGVMGQPGLQRHPGYVLEGEGERVLSEKKLEELVREVTGSGGGEGTETLEPEVKETLLDLADEFIDNVVMAACKVAKLRSSSTLDIRDIQLILERNYNIRVPGYASDELRTVKKIVPSQAWAAKMSAVQAAKVTGGKGDI